MTREEAVAKAPHGRRFYWIALVSCAAMGLAFLSDLFARSSSLAVRVAAIGGSCIFLFAALQSAERLFYPERAAVRSDSWPETQLKWIERIASTVAVATVGLVFVALAARFSDLLSRDKAHDLQMTAWGLWILTMALRDLLGQDNFYRQGPAHAVVPWTPLSPIQSEHWGER